MIKVFVACLYRNLARYSAWYMFFSILVLRLLYLNTFPKNSIFSSLVILLKTLDEYHEKKKDVNLLKFSMVHFICYGSYSKLDDH